MVDVLVVGSLNADIMVRTQDFPAPGETVRATGLEVGPGGKGGNQAAAARRHGVAVRLVGVVGDDSHGAMLLEAAVRTGIDVSGIRTADGKPSGVAVITINERGENTIVVAPGANDSLEPDTAVEAVREAGRGGVLCLTLETSPAIALVSSREARANDRRVILNLSPYEQVPDDLLELVDVLVMNEHEAGHLCGGTFSTQTLQHELVRWDVRQAIVTLGARGCVVLDNEGREPIREIRAGKVARVVDTTGAGDAFLGSLAARLALGSGIIEAAQEAVHAASLTVGTAGAQSVRDATETMARTP